MGCLVAILLFILFPFIYLRVQIWRTMNRFKKQQEEHFQQRSAQNVRDEEPQNTSQSEKKKHVFKDGEGEYVDFEEE